MEDPLEVLSDLAGGARAAAAADVVSFRKESSKNVRICKICGSRSCDDDPVQGPGTPYAWRTNGHDDINRWCDECLYCDTVHRKLEPSLALGDWYAKQQDEQYNKHVRHLKNKVVELRKEGGLKARVGKRSWEAMMAGAPPPTVSCSTSTINDILDPELKFVTTSVVQ